MIRVVVADDHPLIRRGLKSIIDYNDETVLAGEAGNAEEAVEAVKKGDADVIVLDYHMPGMSGIDLIKAVKAANPNVGVLILSASPEEAIAFRAIKAGASGFISKSKADDELENAIIAIKNKGKYISPSVAEILADEYSRRADNMEYKPLSDREFQILKLITVGKTMKEIASELNIALSTANTYKYRLMRKMNAKNVAELTRYAIERDLIG